MISDGTVARGGRLTRDGCAGQPPRCDFAGVTHTLRSWLGAFALRFRAVATQVPGLASERNRLSTAGVYPTANLHAAAPRS